jgi:hypothetical protein
MTLDLSDLPSDAALLQQVVLDRVSVHPASRIAALLPDYWHAAQQKLQARR